MTVLLRLTIAVLLIVSSTNVYAQTAADEFYDPQEMAAARHALRHGHGDHAMWFVSGERIEYQSNDGDPLMVWEGQGWIGKDLHKLWLKTEGEYEADGGHLEEGEVQVLYSRAVHSFWDFQTGLRHDFKPSPSRTYAVAGFQGLAPHWFEIDTAAYLSDQGDLSIRIEAEYEWRFTQRLILQPRLELNVALTDDIDTLTGTGLSALDAGLRLRYEMRREFAPYIGVGWHGAFGDTKDLLQSAGEESGEVSFIAGIRFWY